MEDLLALPAAGATAMIGVSPRPLAPYGPHGNSSSTLGHFADPGHALLAERLLPALLDTLRLRPTASIRPRS